MTIHRNYFKTSALALALCVALPAFAAEEVGVSVGKHHFVFYKDHDIYYAPDTKVYYWNQNGSWISGAALPVDQQRYITSSGGIDIELDTVKPYERHDYVVAHYKNGPATTTRETSTTTRDDGAMTTTTTTTTKHNYVYYADHDIYFAPDTKTYFWRSNGTWTSGATLPPEDMAFVRSKGITIELDTDKPYERHDYVIAHYKHHHDRDDQ